ncbi:uncharacterized protein [Procambarus clarkii]|uniref:uncharacterized protein isoform X2 n=1 Tax=Procambarus clarkii TaxID=6728 RepID=UPI00374269F7
MVAGGVQSVEDGALYTTHASYYPQFYSTLLPPAPPGSYSSSNYSSSTHSSSGQSSDCSWLRLEGVEGVCGTAPPGRARHPRCTCPSPESLRKARKALAARRVRAWRDPRCTCPSPPGSRDASPWSGTSPSPPSTPATASPPPRQPRCTCPDSDLSHKLTGARRARSARDLRCTCPTTTPPPAREPRCTCPPHVQEQDKRSCKGRLVHAVLLNYPGSTAISTDHGDFVRLSPAKMAEALKARGEDEEEKEEGKSEEEEEEGESEGGGQSGGRESAPPSHPPSPARRVKDKLCHLRHKVVSGVAALAAARPLHAHGKDGDGRVCRCEASEARLRGRAPGVVTRILPAAAAADTRQETKASPEAPTKGNATFPMEDLPQPLLGDLCSPLGEVPPLSPPERPPVTQDNLPLHPLTRHVTSDVTQASCSSTPTKAATRGGGSRRDPSVSLRNLRHLQQLSASHGHLDASLEASLSRTRSLEIYVKDLAQQAARQPPSLLAAASAYHLTLAPQTDQQRWTKKILPQSPPPGRRQSPPPGRRQSPPPGRRQSPPPGRRQSPPPGRRQSPPPGRRQSPSPGRRQSPPPGRRQSPPPGRRQSPPPGRRQSPPPGRRQSPPPSRRQSRERQVSPPCLSAGAARLTADLSSKASAPSLEDAEGGPDYENVAFHNTGGYVMLSKRLLDQWQLSYEACLPPDVAFVENAGNGRVEAAAANGQLPSSALPADLQESDDVALALRAPTPSTQTPPPSTYPSSSILLSPHFTHSGPISTPWLLPTTRTPTYNPSLPSSLGLPSPATTTSSRPASPLPSPATTLHHLATQHVGGLLEAADFTPRRPKLEHKPQEKRVDTLRKRKKEDIWLAKSQQSDATKLHLRRHSDAALTYHGHGDDGDTDQETDRLLGQQRSDDPGFYDEKGWRRPKTRTVMPRATNHKANGGGATSNGSTPSTPIGQGQQVSTNQTPSSPPDMASTNKNKAKKEKEANKKKGRSKEVMIHEPAVLIEGVLFRARYLGSTQLVSEGQPTKTTRMMQAEEAVSRIKAPDGESQPSTEVDLFISTEKIMVLNTDLKEIMMDHALRTISYIADIGDLVVLMARRRVLPTDDAGNNIQKTPKMICHVFESDEAQFIAQSIGQAFQVAYLEFLKANGIEDHSFVKEMDYQEVLNSQEIFGDELQMFAKKELQKEELYVSKTVVVPKMKSEILGVVVVESGWGSMVPTVVIANLSPTGAAAKCGQLNIGDQIIAINGVSLVGLPLSTCQNYIKNTKYNTAVKLTVVPCPPVVEVKIRRPDTKYQLGFSVQNGVICSLLRGGIAERGGVRVGHRIIDINSQSVVAVPHEKIVNLLATSVGEIRMKTMPTSIFRLLTGQETPQYI